VKAIFNRNSDGARHVEHHAFADITKPSKCTVKESVEEFEAAIKAKAAGGWVVFAKIAHAAAAKEAGLEMSSSATPKGARLR
jgi:uncharacterized protein (DUF302 family)